MQSENCVPCDYNHLIPRHKWFHFPWFSFFEMCLHCLAGKGAIMLASGFIFLYSPISGSKRIAVVSCIILQAQKGLGSTASYWLFPESIMRENLLTNTSCSLKIKSSTARIFEYTSYFPAEVHCQPTVRFFLVTGSLVGEQPKMHVWIKT